MWRGKLLAPKRQLTSAEPDKGSLLIGAGFARTLI